MNFFMATDLKKFEQARKTNIANTIGSGLRLGVEELSRTVKVSGAKPKKFPKNQITPEMDKYENRLIEKRKNK